MTVDLDRQLRDYCQHLDEQQGSLSFDDILERTGELQVIPRQGSQHRSSRRKWAAAAAALAIVGTAIGIGLLSATNGTAEPAEQPTTTSTTTATTLAPSVDSTLPLEVRGWPGAGENVAGLYSWDGGRCAGSSCIVGFMHNGFGSGDVDINFYVVSEKPVTDDGATAVTVAGHDGVHRRIDDSWEVWTVDIDGVTVAIRLYAKPGTSQADLAEAHAIIDSIRTEPADNRLGFRLVFTLSTNDWDSG